jgi:hypothetical protein
MSNIMTRAHVLISGAGETIGALSQVVASWNGLSTAMRRSVYIHLSTVS